jgi:peptidoglycan/xylan/chitin deacetylase (PgdA/CDA1 family)
MFLAEQIKNIPLPDKTLCMTFDDGPGETTCCGKGPKTEKLAEYLAEQGIRAAFFMVGRFIERFPEIPPSVSALGHIIGNHCYSHSGRLPDLLNEGKDIVWEIERVDQLIRAYLPADKVYFRAPWGEWTPEVAARLNEQIGNGLDHIGPFHWDIDTDDWSFWRDNRSAEDCAGSFLAKIERVGRGIILMHDSSADDPQARRNNLALETVKLMVPRLRDLGYRFADLDDLTCSGSPDKIEVINDYISK